MDKFSSPLLVLIISDFSTPGNPFSIAKCFSPPLSPQTPVQFDTLLPPPTKDILAFFFIHQIFVESFDVAYTIENLFMVTIKINSGQDTDNFSADTWKISLYDLHFCNGGSGLGFLAENCLDVGFLSYK